LDDLKFSTLNISLRQNHMPSIKVNLDVNLKSNINLPKNSIGV